MRSYIFPVEHYLIEMVAWCVVRFGAPAYMVEWDYGWVSSSNAEFVEFKFYTEELATQFMLVHGDKVDPRWQLKSQL